MLVDQRNYDLHYCLMSKQLYHILLYFPNSPIIPQYDTLTLHFRSIFITYEESIKENNDS